MKPGNMAPDNAIKATSGIRFVKRTPPENVPRQYQFAAFIPDVLYEVKSLGMKSLGAMGLP